MSPNDPRARRSLRTFVVLSTPTFLLLAAAVGVAAWLLPPARLTPPTSPTAATCEGSAEADDAEEPEALPARLGDLGLFADLASLAVLPGTEGYAVRFPAWNDGAAARRHVRLPDGARLDVGPSGGFAIPVGATFAQTFEAPGSGRRLETRVLKKTASRTLAGVYVWNAAGDDAELLLGYDRALDVTLPGCDAPYVAPSRVSCVQCHAGAEDMVAGFAPWQLGREGMASLAAAGRLAQDVAAYGEVDVRAANPDEAAALGALAANCAHCHHPGGGAYVASGLDLRPSAALAAIGRPATRLVHGDARLLIAPGDPRRSVLVRAVARTLAPGQRMPPVGPASVDDETVAKLERWIRGLPAPDGASEGALVVSSGKGSP